MTDQLYQISLDCTSACYKMATFFKNNPRKSDSPVTAALRLKENKIKNLLQVSHVKSFKNIYTVFPVNITLMVTYKNLYRTVNAQE